MSTFLSRYELEALEGICAWQSRGGLSRINAYFWKQASMKKLHARGFVEPTPGYERYKPPGWRITKAGRDHLKGFPQS